MLVFLCREFGAKVINLKTLMKALPSLFEHSDKNVRAEVWLTECRVPILMARVISWWFSEVVLDCGKSTLGGLVYTLNVYQGFVYIGLRATTF